MEFPDSNIGNIAPKPTESNLQQPNPPVQQPSPNTMDYQKRLEGWKQTGPSRPKGPFNVFNRVTASYSEAFADNNTFTNSTNNLNFTNSNISNTGFDAYSRSPSPTASNITESGGGSTSQISYTASSYSGAPEGCSTRNSGLSTIYSWNS